MSRGPGNDYRRDCAYHEAAHAVVSLAVGGRVVSLTIDPLPGRSTQSGLEYMWQAVAVLAAGTTQDYLRDSVIHPREIPSGRGRKHDILTSLFCDLKTAKGMLPDFPESDFGKIAKGFGKMTSAELRRSFGFAIDALISNRALVRIIAERLIREGTIAGEAVNCLADFMEAGERKATLKALSNT